MNSGGDVNFNQINNVFYGRGEANELTPDEGVLDELDDDESDDEDESIRQALAEVPDDKLMFLLDRLSEELIQFRLERMDFNNDLEDIVAKRDKSLSLAASVEEEQERRAGIDGIITLAGGWWWLKD
ncbi:hypothetical protein F53441_6874 [Fusarium austroafricanum]|uniref:Uncharacterized protein n=1 Tax=Fusarium austroafricanum TaxID=2364996 RepID=A0A8H4NW44_9HYPO|nr:hypothetical protein F53441_6874 [Fusarium austroafricanum]